MQTSKASLKRTAEVAIITVDNPPVNAISAGFPEAVHAALDEALNYSDVQAIVLTGAGQTFIAGADIKLLSDVAAQKAELPDLNSFLFAIETSPKPVVVAIDGVALGGGLETAMAGHYRVISRDAKVGQPEVTLGLIPGMGGTQRLPRLAGVEKALEMCTTGELVDAASALACGIVDRLATGDLLAEAVQFARDVVGSPIRRTSEQNEKLHAVDTAIFARFREQVQRLRRGEQAPLLAVDAIEAATRLPFSEGFTLEQALFLQCLRSPQSRALMHIFFGERSVTKIPGLTLREPVRDIRRAAVVGAGTMGTGIAMTFANAGIPVLLNDVSEPALERGMTAIRRNYAAAVQKGRISPELMERTLARITPQASFENFEIADIVVEAAYENLKVKKQVFAAISNTTKPECLLATNTSSLDIDAIAAATVRPASVVGLHFFSPANVMRLVEVVRGTATTDDTIAATMNVAKRLGKIAVLSRNAFGFIGNRLVIPYVREAHFLLEEGASVEQVNRALFDFGMRMGPLTMEDLIGLDVMQAIREESRVRQNLRTRQPLAPDLLYQAGLFGQKSGSGWSQYDEKRHASPNPASAQLIAQAAEKAGTRRRQISNEEIVQRCVYALINEGAKVLEEKIALRAVDIDIVYVYGYGFPAWRGGPMFYAQTIGPGTVLNAIEGFAKEFGEDLWQPSERLREMAR